MESGTSERGKFRGEFITECYRKGELIWTDKTHNIITDEGLNRILSVFFAGGTQTATWYCGLVESNTAPTGDETYDVPVFTESTAYDEAARPAYVETVTAASCTNSASKAVFTINATKTMYGAALFSISTKGDHTGGANNVLACYAQFAASRAVVDDDVINLTYTVTAADDGV